MIFSVIGSMLNAAFDSPGRCALLFVEFHKHTDLTYQILLFSGSHQNNQPLNGDVRMGRLRNRPRKV